MRSLCTLAAALVAVAVVGCDEAAGPSYPEPPFEGTAPAGPWFPPGDDGVAEPRGADAEHAHAGRATAEMLPDWPSGLQTWEAGDFILANDRVAVVIEDVGPSDLYDPWGGRPVGVARVEGGALVEPANFGEFFIFLGAQSVVTEFVGVINDGRDGEAAVVRAQGRGEVTPFLDFFIGGIFSTNFSNVPTAIDYVLEPGAEHVDVYLNFQNYNDYGITSPGLYGFIFGDRMPPFHRGDGFRSGAPTDVVVFEDAGATSWGFGVPTGELSNFVTQAGFNGYGGPTLQAAAHELTRVHYARLYIGGRGLEGVIAAHARSEGRAVRTITGTVFEADGTTPAAGVRVNAEELGGASPVFATHTMTDAQGRYEVTVAAGADAQLSTFRAGDTVIGPDMVPSSAATHDFTLAPSGFVRVLATEMAPGDPAIPAKVHLIPAGASENPTAPDAFGEAGEQDWLHEAYTAGQHGEPLGQVTLRAPVGDWEVLVMRGPEYSYHRETVSVTAAHTSSAPLVVNAALVHEVDTTGVMCGDFHVHTWRSSDSGIPTSVKVERSAADQLDIMCRSEHEYLETIDPLVTSMGLGDFLFGSTSVELTTMRYYGHFGVIGIEPGVGVNGGTPQWVDYPTVANRDIPVSHPLPPAMLDRVRARAEAPAIMVNHPRGTGNYFDYVGFDPDTGTIADLDAWDYDFTMMAAKNWTGVDSQSARDWFALLAMGRPMFVVGGSDSHSLRGHTYPRSCMNLGTDNPREVTQQAIRDALRDGHSTLSGGVFIDVTHGSAGPGDTLTGVGATTSLDVRVQAVSWLAGDFIMEVVVDGALVETIDLASDVTERFNGQVSVDVAPGGSWVVLGVRSTSGTKLSPVLPGKAAFGVSNPIFLEP